MAERYFINSAASRCDSVSDLLKKNIDHLSSELTKWNTACRY